MEARVDAQALANRSCASSGYVDGLRRMAPLLAAYAPFGLTIGAQISRHPDPVACWAGTLLIYGGSAQLALVQSTAAGSSVWAALMAGLLVHSRLVVYSLSLAPHWRSERRWFQVLASATLTDPTWAMASGTYADGPDPTYARWAHLGAVSALTVGWLTMVSVGLVVGPGLTNGAGVALAAPLCLLALVVPRVRNRPGQAAAIAGALASVAGRGLPSGMNIAVAIAAGTVAGLAVGRDRS